jgi:hypothetical protein
LRFSKESREFEHADANEHGCARHPEIGTARNFHPQVQVLSTLLPTEEALRGTPAQHVMHRAYVALRCSHPRAEEAAMAHTNPPAEISQCIDSCTTCHRACLDAAGYCLQQGGVHAAADHVGLLLDCAQICNTTADFLIRSAPLHAGVCGACADVCDKCADSCDQFTGDAAMAACASACRSCAAACRRAALATLSR